MQPESASLRQPPHLTNHRPTTKQLPKVGSVVQLPLTLLSSLLVLKQLEFLLPLLLLQLLLHAVVLHLPLVLQ